MLIEKDGSTKFSQCPKIVVVNPHIFTGCLHSRSVIKKANQLRLAPPCRNCAWDYNGTNSPRRTGLKKDHNS